MKFQAILATLASLTVAALAIPVDNVSERVTLRGDEIKSLVHAIRGAGVPDVLGPDQSISCNITYSLAIGASAPFAVMLTALDLSNCSFSP